MRSHRWLNILHLVIAFACAVAVRGAGADSSGPVSADPSQAWNWHLQSTAIVQGDPGFSAAYSGPDSLNPQGEIKETVSFDLYAGARLWQGAEAHVDGLMWQGFGLSNTEGVEGFPNGEAFRLGRHPPGAIVARLFLRQTFDLGGPSETVEDDALDLASQRTASRLTLTLGKISVKDIFDNNAYANDPRTQFMSWSLMANEAWDYPADSLGFETGFAAELNQPDWTIRYGFFQVPRYSNAMPTDMHLLKAWGMVLEFERRYKLGGRPGAARLLVFDNRAHMGSYQAALDAPERPADIIATRSYRSKRGVGINVEQEIARNIGVFSRLGWSDGENEAWVFADVDYAGSLGVNLAGEGWQRPGDTFAVAGVVSGISHVHQEFLAAGGTGILAGDGALNYGTERLVETYYQVLLAKALRFTIDYQFVSNPAYNRDRGPVSVFAARVHWEF